MWMANVFTIFPDAFPGNLGISIIGKALRSNKWNLNIIDLKKFPVKSERLDSPPYGGGAGMILSPITFENAFNTLSEPQKKMKRIYFSPRGKLFNQKDIDAIGASDGITILCGRYEGVDQRILEIYKMEEVSIGDFVLLGGEAAAMTIIEACVRSLPGIVGEQSSVQNDSFQDNLLEYNQYTKPRIFNSVNVPDILLSGNHKEISKFRKEQSKQITMTNRPDLWAKYVAYEMSKINL